MGIKGLTTLLDKTSRSRNEFIYVLPLVSWILNYFISIIFAHFMGSVDDISFSNYILVPSVIVTVTILQNYLGISKKLGVQDRYVSCFFTPFHAAWAYYISIGLPDNYDGFVLATLSTVGFLFLNFFAGFIGTIVIILICWGILLLFINIFEVTIGLDEKFMFIFLAFISFWLSIINEGSKRLKQKLSKIKKELSKSNLSLKKINKINIENFQNVSHEMRTPLTLIINPLEKLRKKMPDIEEVNVAVRNSKRLLSLVNQILDFQKVTTGNIASKLYPININKFLDTCADYFEPSCRKKDIEFLLELPEEETYYILGDVDSLEKIVFNYLSNALKYTPSGGKIKLNLAQVNEKVRIEVLDTGAGISKDKQNKLFKLFSQVDGSSLREFEGTGLGLALVKELADKMKGEVGVHSTEQIGSNFWAEFLVYKRNKDNPGLLVIDDEEAINNRIEEVIEADGRISRVNCCTSAEDAMKILEEEEYKCVLSDLVLPGEDGISLLTYVKNKYPAAKRLLMTGQVEVLDKSKTINKASIDHIFLKPINFSELPSTIFNLVKDYDASINKDREVIDLIYVDDDEASLESVSQMILQSYPEFEIASCDTPKEARQILLEKNVRCVLSDFNMPEENGIELLSYVKNVSPNTTRILITGDEYSKIPKEAVTKAKIDEVFSKPFDSEKLNIIKSSIIKNKMSEKKSLSSKNQVIDILFVDDEVEVQRSFEKLALSSGRNYEIKLANNAETAKKIVLNNKVRCVVSDFAMPGESGVDLLAFTNTFAPETARILITGKGIDKISPNVVSEAKVNEVIAKPLDLNILKIIDDYIKGSPIKESEDNLIDLDEYKPKDWHLDDILTDKEEIVDDDDEEINSSNSELVLVVDDLKDMRNLLYKILKNQNFRVIKAKNGLEGLEKARKYKPDVAIIDWMMPVMNGIEMLEKIKEEKEISAMPTIFLTAKGDDESKHHGQRLGANSYIGKPFDEYEVVSAVNNLLKLKEGEKEIDRLNKELSEGVLKRFLPGKIVDAIIKSGGKIERESKMVTVTILFCDICSFTDRSSELGPRNISIILNEFIEEMTQCVFESDGIVDKIIGDCIMAVFGVPEKMDVESQARKAFECAKLMQKGMKKLSEKWSNEYGVSFKLRVGIHSGPAIVGYFGSDRRLDYTAIGPTVNLASRIEKAAGEGETFFSQEVRDVLQEDVWVKAGSYDIKGIGSRVLLFKAKEESI